MAIDYHKMLTDLRSEEQRLVTELDAVRAMIPGAEVMARRMPSSAPSPPLPISMSRFPYFGMGTKEAILRLLSTSANPLMPSDITKALLEGGVQTRASDFAGTVGSTLTQMKGETLVERKEDGWVVTATGHEAAKPPGSSLGDSQFSQLNYLASIGPRKP